MDADEAGAACFKASSLYAPVVRLLNRVLARVGQNIDRQHAHSAPSRMPVSRQNYELLAADPRVRNASMELRGGVHTLDFNAQAAAVHEQQQVQLGSLMGSRNTPDQAPIG